MSSSKTPSFGVASVTMTEPGPWTVICHSLPWRSLPVSSLPCPSSLASCCGELVAIGCVPEMIGLLLSTVRGSNVVG